MKRIWLYLYAHDKKEVDIQREGLTKHCRENHMNIVGETVMIRETKLDLDGFSAAINCAVENRCDYLATYKTETIEMDDQMGIAICEAYIESNLSLYSTNDGAFMEKIYKALPWLKLWNAPNLFSMNEDLDAGEKPEYPEPRWLDSINVRVKRQGKICKLTFTDLCEDEQLFALSCMSKEEIKTLMMQLACSMQRLVNLFDIRRNQDGQLTAKGKEHLLIQQ